MMCYDGSMGKKRTRKSPATKRPNLTPDQISHLPLRSLRKLIPGGRLERYSHPLPYGDSDVPDQVCLMEAVAWFADEEHSDDPKCTCPVLAALAIEVNDRADDDLRQELITMIPRLIGTRVASARTRFLRVQSFMRSVVTYAVDRLEESDQLNCVHVELLQRARSSSAGRLCRSKIDRVIAALEIFEDSSRYVDLREMLLAAQDILRTVRRHWRPAGISRAQYEDVFIHNLYEFMDQHALRKTLDGILDV